MFDIDVQVVHCSTFNQKFVGISLAWPLAAAGGGVKEHAAWVMTDRFKNINKNVRCTMSFA